MKIHVYMKNKEYDVIGYEYIEKFINNFSDIPNMDLDMHSIKSKDYFDININKDFIENIKNKYKDLLVVDKLILLRAGSIINKMIKE